MRGMLTLFCSSDVMVVVWGILTLCSGGVMVVV